MRDKLAIRFATIKLIRSCKITQVSCLHPKSVAMVAVTGCCFRATPHINTAHQMPISSLYPVTIGSTHAFPQSQTTQYCHTVYNTWQCTLSCNSCWSRSAVNLYPAVFQKHWPDCNKRLCHDAYYLLVAMVATTARRHCSSTYHKTENL